MPQFQASQVAYFKVVATVSFRRLAYVIIPGSQTDKWNRNFNPTSDVVDEPEVVNIGFHKMNYRVGQHNRESCSCLHHVSNLYIFHYSDQISEKANNCVSFDTVLSRKRVIS